jgi:hypothetical protein
MSSMRNRQEGFEKKFAMDEDSKFKAMARRNKLLGLWAAEKLGKTGADADAYAKEVVRADFEEAGDDDVFRTVRADFDAAGVAQSDHQIHGIMDELLVTAVDEIKNACVSLCTAENRRPAGLRKISRTRHKTDRGDAVK